MVIVFCMVCGHVFNVPLMKHQILADNKIVRKCPKCYNEVEIKKHENNKNTIVNLTKGDTKN